MSTVAINTALLSAASRGDVVDAERLLAKGANVHTEHKSALRLAAENGHISMVALLLDSGSFNCARSSEALRYAAYLAALVDHYLRIQVPARPNFAAMRTRSLSTSSPTSTQDGRAIACHSHY